jgi:hypothetical protein
MHRACIVRDMENTNTTKHVETFGDMLTGIASLSISPLEDGRFAVIRRLPCGMDIAPHVYGRFETRDEAQICFDSKRASVAKMMVATA